MITSHLVQQRLRNQHLAENPFEKPEQVVSWLGAVQAQEYPGAKWGLAQRLNGISDAAIDQAFAEGKLLRTHLLRPTWHFVAPADIRWLQQLTAPRVHALNAYYYRKFGLDEAVFAQTNAILVKALEGDKQLTRSELEVKFLEAGISAHAPSPADDVLRLAYIMMQSELNCLICSGVMRGKQHTYALLEERVPPVKTLSHDEALATLTLRFFSSHGPATVKDYVWWSGLTVADAKIGIELVKARLAKENVNGNTYWFAPSASIPEISSTKTASPIAHLLPAYDEYTIAYKDDIGVLASATLQQVVATFGVVIVINGTIVGAWKRVLKQKQVEITLTPFRSLTEAEQLAVNLAAERFGRFLDLPVLLT